MILSVDINSKAVTRVALPDLVKECSADILEVDGASALVLVSSVNHSQVLYSVDFSNFSNPVWTRVMSPRDSDEGSNLWKAVESVSYQIIRSSPPEDKSFDGVFDTILLTPSNVKGPIPLIMFPHGGPQ